jgi:protein FRG1
VTASADSQQQDFPARPCRPRRPCSTRAIGHPSRCKLLLSTTKALRNLGQFVCTLLPDAQTKCTLRSASGRFLAIDSTGTFGAPTEARGAQEEFEFIAHPTVAGAFALKSVYYGKYLTIDEVAGGRLDYRGDADAIGADEAFTVKMQAKFEHENERKQQSERPTRASDGLVIIKDVKGAEDDRI